MVYTLLMYWAHRLNTDCIRGKWLHHFAQGELDHHKGINTGAPLWVHLSLGLLAAIPFVYLSHDFAPLLCALSVSASDRAWHHIDHIAYHHRQSFTHNYGLGIGAVWDLVFRTYK